MTAPWETRPSGWDAKGGHDPTCGDGGSLRAEQPGCDTRWGSWAQPQQHRSQTQQGIDGNNVNCVFHQKRIFGKIRGRRGSQALARVPGGGSVQTDGGSQGRGAGAAERCRGQSSSHGGPVRRVLPVTQRARTSTSPSSSRRPSRPACLLKVPVRIKGVPESSSTV